MKEIKLVLFEHYQPVGMHRAGCFRLNEVAGNAENTGRVIQVSAFVEGYFDESGDLDDAPGVFCISGYFIQPEAARAMHADWLVMLEKYQLDFFHMVDCAPDPGNEGFAHLTKKERIDVATE